MLGITCIPGWFYLKGTQNSCPRPWAGPSFNCPLPFPTLKGEVRTGITGSHCYMYLPPLQGLGRYLRDGSICISLQQLAQQWQGTLVPSAIGSGWAVHTCPLGCPLLDHWGGLSGWAAGGVSLGSHPGSLLRAPGSLRQPRICYVKPPTL